MSARGKRRAGHGSFQVMRATQRTLIGVGDKPLFMGADLWTAYELSWLNSRGKPQVALLRLVVPADSPHIIESKSLKLYLGSFSNTPMSGPEEVVARVRADISAALWHGAAQPGVVGVQLIQPDQFEMEKVQELDGLSLDRLDGECRHYPPAPELLRAQFDEPPIAISNAKASSIASGVTMSRGLMSRSIKVMTCPAA